MTGRTVRLWAGPGARAAGRLPGQGPAVPARCPRPGPPRRGRCPPRRAAAAAPASGDVIEVERTVNASGNVSLGDHMLSAGLPLAGQRVTLRLDGPVAHILTGGILACTIACPLLPEARSRLRGARAGTAQPPRLPEPLAVTRRVSARGAIMIGGQKIQVGLAHAPARPPRSAWKQTPTRSPSNPASPSPRRAPRAGTSGGARPLTTPDGDAAERPDPYAFSRSRECRWGLSCRA